MGKDDHLLAPKPTLSATFEGEDGVCLLVPSVSPSLSLSLGLQEADAQLSQDEHPGLITQDTAHEVATRASLLGGRGRKRGLSGLGYTPERIVYSSLICFRLERNLRMQRAQNV